MVTGRDRGREGRRIRLSRLSPSSAAPSSRRSRCSAPTPTSCAAFRRGFEQLGGRVEGSVRTGQVAAQARFLGSIPSASLMQIIRETNKNSNNLMARQLFLTVGAVLTGKPPSPAESVRAIHAWLAQRVPERRPSSWRTAPGCRPGTSDGQRHDLAARPHPHLSLCGPVSRYAARGRGGRHHAGAAAGAARRRPVRGQDRTLRDTRAIAGIVVSKRGRSYVFCMIVNHPRASASLQTIDHLIARFHSLPPGGSWATALQQ